MRRNLTLALLFAGTLAAQQPAFTPYHASGIYELGEKAGWKVTAGEAAGPYEYVIRKNNAEVIRSGTLDFSKGDATIEASLDEPAMLYVEVTEPAAAKPVPVHLGAAIAPAKLKPAVPRPADFDRFWQGKLQTLREIPINPPRRGENKAGSSFTVRLDSAGSHVRASGKARDEGKFPALVIYQYAGVYALQPNTVTDRAAKIRARGRTITRRLAGFGTARPSRVIITPAGAGEACWRYGLNPD